MDLPYEVLCISCELPEGSFETADITHVGSAQTIREGIELIISERTRIIQNIHMNNPHERKETIKAYHRAYKTDPTHDLKLFRDDSFFAEKFFPFLEKIYRVNIEHHEVDIEPYA